MTTRRSGSVRFDPYFKIQWYDPRSVAWRDVQRSFPDRGWALSEACDTLQIGRVFRLMRVTPDGRTPEDQTYRVVQRGTSDLTTYERVG